MIYKAYNIKHKKKPEIILNPVTVTMNNFLKKWMPGTLPAKLYVCSLFFIFFVVLCTAGCTSREQPPFYTAKVTTVYNEELVVERFNLLYWWEERGETPFLKPYELHAKECIVEIMQPLKEDPDKVQFTTRRFNFSGIDAINVVLAPIGKNIVIALKSGETITATDRFPRVLKDGRKTGFADYKVYASGRIKDAKEHKEFKKELNFLKKIEFIKVTDK